MALKITNKKKMPKPDRIIPVAAACMPKSARVLHKAAMGVYRKALESLADGHAHLAHHQPLGATGQRRGGERRQARKAVWSHPASHGIRRIIWRRAE